MQGKKGQGSSWQRAVRVGELIDYFYAKLPPHVGIPRLLEYAEILCSRGQFDLAKRKCYQVGPGATCKLFGVVDG